MSVPEKIPLSGLSRGDLEALTERLLAENAELKQAVTELRAEIAKLKGVTGRPTIRPSGMEQKTEPTDKAGKRGVKQCKTERLVIHEERVIKADVPAGSRFKGYEDFVVQDLVLRPHVVRIRRERWLTPDGQTVLAPMPAGVAGHFGPELRRFVLLQYHQGQVTMPRLVTQLRAIGIVISKRQVGSTRTPAPSSRRPCCGPGWKRRPGSASMTPAPGTRTATAHKLATITSPPRRAG